MISQKDQFFSKETFCSLVAYFGLAEEHVDVPLPAILKPVPLWTGKQVFTCIVKPNQQSRTFVNFEMKEKNYDNEKNAKHFCRNDGFVAFRNGELISGNIAKKTIGDGSKTGLLYVLLRDFGPAYAASFMDRFSKFCARYFGMHRGFSMGISDVSPSSSMKKMKFDILSAGYKKVRTDTTTQNKCRAIKLNSICIPSCLFVEIRPKTLSGNMTKGHWSCARAVIYSSRWKKS